MDHGLRLKSVVTKLAKKQLQIWKTIRTLMNADMRRIQRMIIIEDNSTPTSNDESLIKARVASEKLTQSLKKIH